MRPVLSNLGFVMQIAGLFLILPIASAFYLNETETLISFFVTGFSFFVLGFVLNALSVRAEAGKAYAAIDYLNVFRVGYNFCLPVIINPQANYTDRKSP